mmetsp:Transcript_4265/g.14109  ORF Transcript_4265/g.14109 Transcript_4265/m.14109 type:complete len:334 (+) Transcript_4265:911-1912(+)
MEPSSAAHAKLAARRVVTASEFAFAALLAASASSAFALSALLSAASAALAAAAALVVDDTERDAFSAGAAAAARRQPRRRATRAAAAGWASAALSGKRDGGPPRRRPQRRRAGRRADAGARPRAVPLSAAPAPRVHGRCASRGGVRWRHGPAARGGPRLPARRRRRSRAHKLVRLHSRPGRQPHAARRPGPTHGVDARHGSQGGPGAGVRKGVRGGRDLTVMSLRPQLLTPPTCSDDRLSVDGECRAGRREGGAPLGCTDSSRSVCMQGGGVPRHAALGCSSPRPPTTRGQRLRGCKRGVAMCSGCETLVSLLSMICCTPVFSGAPSRVCAVA